MRRFSGYYSNYKLMPEGPIIVILKENVMPFKGEKVIAAGNNNRKLDASKLEGENIVDFKSFGKNFFICFKDFSVRIHLMMFGSYLINEHRDKPARLNLTFEDGEINFYSCVVELIEEPLDKLYDFTADVMNPEWNAAKAIKKLKAEPEMLACDALLDQDIFAGVGNIIKNEVLFRTRIHPKSTIGAIPTKKLKEMVDEAVIYSFDFLKWKKGGEFKKHWLAYSQKTCPRDKVPFHKVDMGKGHRSTFYCDICEVLY